VVVLTDSNFDDTIYNSKDIWMVEFYAPWCGHCKNLEPEWNAAASELVGKVKFAKIDATENGQLASKFGVKGYPTIKYFEYGKKSSPSAAKPYEQGRDQQSIVSFAKDLLEKSDIEPELHELVSKKVYENNCSGTKICVLAFMPNIYDSSAKERNEYMETYMKVAKKQQKNPMEFFWL
jgi:protein disulfide-isomerase A6